MSTARDKSVLNMILNPMMPNEDIDVDSQNSGNHSLSLPNIEECEKLEVEGVKFAEGKKFEDALSKLNEAIRICPENPSPYNNRAQVFRFQDKVEEALADLDKAIDLSGKMERKKTASQAFCQRALIHQLRGNTDQAKVDYEKAASMGSAFAKMQLVALNPYAAMCNAMLSEVLAKTQHFEGQENVD